MSIVHPALLLGLVLAAIPVVLHLLMRARPKKLTFPALRLLQQRRIQNRRRLRLRHVWLLLLRMLLIAGLVLALARPSLPPANYTLNWSELARLVIILAAVGITYFSVLRWWNQQALPKTQLLNRRTYLRGGSGLVAFLLCLLLVGWPYQRRLAAELTSPAPPAVDNLPVAAVFLCDTSLSMTYQFAGASRLDAATAIAVEHLGRLPSGSQAAVFDAGDQLPAVLSQDLTAVQNRLKSLTPQSIVDPLDDRLRAAIRFQVEERRRLVGDDAAEAAGTGKQDRFVREIYVLTDLARSAWRGDQSAELKAELETHSWLALYVIDVGAEAPQNVGVTRLRASRPSVSEGGEVAVDAQIRSIGVHDKDAVVELWQSTDDGPMVKRDQRTVRLSKSESVPVNFVCDKLEGRLLQSELRLLTADPLMVDNSAFLSVPILGPLKVLVAAEGPQIAAFWIEAINGLNATGSGYDVTFRRVDQLKEVTLSEFDVVCLINAERPTAESWNRLRDYVSEGGGLLVCLGASSSVATGQQARGIDPVSYTSSAALEVLPATAKASLTFSPPQHLSFRGSVHPMGARLEALGVFAELNDVDFRRYWSVEPHAGGAVIARWTDSNASPALLSRPVGNGLCLLFTSSVDSTAWSDWPRNWTYLAVADQMLQALSRRATNPHTRTVGDPVVLPLENLEAQVPVLLRLPDLTQRRIEVPAGEREASITDAIAIGQYQLVQSSMPPRLLTGFSMNLPDRESDLTRFTADDLDGLFGVGRYGLARDPEQLSRTVLAGRMGQEVSGVLLALLIGVFVLEQSTSTWFYRQDET